MFPIISLHVCYDVDAVTCEAPRSVSDVGPTVYVYWQTFHSTVSFAVYETFLFAVYFLPRETTSSG